MCLNSSFQKEASYNFVQSRELIHQINTCHSLLLSLSPASFEGLRRRFQSAPDQNGGRERQSKTEGADG